MLELQQTVESARQPAVKTIDRAARVLRVLASGGSDGLALRVVASECELGKGTAHRLLAALIDAGFAYQDHRTRRYRLGAGLSLLAQAANRQHIGDLARLAIRRIAEQTADTVYVAVREGPAAIYVGREIGAFPIRAFEVGERRPLGVGSSALAMLASLPDEEVEALLAKNDGWIAQFPGYSSASLRDAVARARHHGFAFVDGRRIPGMNAIGVPVHDASGAVVAALSVAGIAERVSGNRIAALADLLQREAAMLTKAISA